MESMELPNSISWNRVGTAEHSSSSPTLYLSGAGCLERAWNQRNFAAEKIHCCVWVTALSHAAMCACFRHSKIDALLNCVLCEEFHTGL